MVCVLFTATTTISESEFSAKIKLHSFYAQYSGLYFKPVALTSDVLDEHILASVLSAILPEGLIKLLKATIGREELRLNPGRSSSKSSSFHPASANLP